MTMIGLMDLNVLPRTVFVGVNTAIITIMEESSLFRDENLEKILTTFAIHKNKKSNLTKRLTLSSICSLIDEDYIAECFPLCPLPE